VDGRTSAVRPFIASRVAALSDHPLSTKAAGIIVRKKNKDLRKELFLFS
jgi:putative aminopeptidase FrvX